MISYWINKEEIFDNILIPKYYDPGIVDELSELSIDYHLYNIRHLIDEKIIEASTGDEIGKLSYGTGDIPFIRTSDISNWEIKSQPKQGVSEDIYQIYNKKQDVQPGDILLVRDGTYLIGTNCFITELDSKILYQSHIVKFRIIEKSFLQPEIFFIALNSDIVQRQIRSIQFSSDIIDTIGNRYLDIKFPYPKDEKKIHFLVDKVQSLLKERVLGKAFIRQCPKLIEYALVNNQHKNLSNFFAIPISEIKDTLNQDTISAEFGTFQAFFKKTNEIANSILLPKYYDPSINEELSTLEENCDIISFADLRDAKIIEYHTGDEIGKMAYGTGVIPFIRTSDFSNWEIKHDPKQGISEEIYDQYSNKQDVKVDDILFVRDGTYLIGTSCIVSDYDSKSLFCGGIYKIRIIDKSKINPYLLLGLLNSYIVKRQIRTKQFTRDVIDTIGHRIDEILIPIPKDDNLKFAIASSIEKIVKCRIHARNELSRISKAYCTTNENYLSLGQQQVITKHNEHFEEGETATYTLD